MSRIAEAVYGSYASHRSPSFLQRSIDRFLAWQERSHQRQQLGQLSDGMLADIGLSRADVDLEVSKPFWRN
jgi:uncharacterized protein YjiS (DUF1127 family)